ncbi:MAG: prepilin-type N-terminal cleavage/methylation domain-containing protein [Sedimentisphaerales bacterium]|nr:prepilin-type N-terminal cleavage/methylation domain-containing protein [Sedimentisphaerales bacterium]
MKSRRNNKAFTLIEAMIAVSILAAAAAGILLPFAAGASVQMEGARRTLAAKLASDLLEEIIATEYAQIYFTWNGYSEVQGQVKNCQADPASYGIADTLQGSLYSSFRRQVSLSQPMGASGPYYITVRVYYKGVEMAAIGTTIYSY